MPTRQEIIIRPARTGWLQSLRSLVLGPWNPKDPAIAREFGGRPASSGVSVNEDTALNYSAVWSAVSLISSQVASLPLILYKREPNGGKTRLGGSKLYRLLHDEPNPEMTAFVFREVLQAHVLVWGNAYAEIERDLSGRPIALWPLVPPRVQPFRPELGGGMYGELRYRIDGKVELPAANMLHIPGLGYDGCQGYSVIEKARESLGLGIATERFGGSFFGQGSTFGGLLMHPRTLSKQAEENLRSSIEARHKGPDRAHRFLILQEDMKYEQLGIPPNDAQFLETRKFQVEEVARWFNLPPHKLKHLERSTNNNIEHQNLEYYIDCLRPWLVRWEQELNRKLIPRLEQRQQFTEHKLEGLLRGDQESRYRAYAVGRQWGWLSVDDIRDLENLNPLPEGAGQMYLVPINMAPADQLGALIDSQIQKNSQPPSQPNVPNATNERSGAEEIATELREQIAVLAMKLDATMDTKALSDLLASSTKERQTADAYAAELRAELAEKQALLLVAQEQVEKEKQAHAQTEADRIEAALAANASDERALRLAHEANELHAAKQHAESLAALAERAALDAQTTLESVQAAHTEALRVIEAKQKDFDEAIALANHISSEWQTKLEKASTEHEAALLTAREATYQSDALAEAKLAETRAALAAAKDAEVIIGTRVAELEQSRDAALSALMEAETKAQAAAAEVQRVLEDKAAYATTASATLEAQRDKERRRLTSVLAAHRGLVLKAMERMIRRETYHARRHRSSPDKLQKRSEAFYDVQFESDFVDEMTPALAVCLAWCHSPEAEAPAEVARGYVREHISESLRQLRAVVDGTTADDFHQVLERTLDKWETERANILADRILRQQIEELHAFGKVA